MKNIRLVAIDLDGTLLDSQGGLSEGNKIMLEKAISEGMHIVIASGRPLGSLPEEVLAIEDIEYAITSNGAAVYHLPNRKRIQRFLLTAESVKRIIGLVSGKEIALEAFVDGIAYADKKYVEDPVRYGSSEKAISYIQRTRNPIEDMERFMEEYIEELDSIDIVVKNQDIKKEIELLLLNVDDIYITSSVKQLVEVSHRDAGKHSGMKFLGELLGIIPEEMAAIGNDRNDIDMVKFAGCGIAVANASEECLQAADVVVRNCDEDGVADAIQKMIKK